MNPTELWSSLSPAEKAQLTRAIYQVWATFKGSQDGQEGDGWSWEDAFSAVELGVLIIVGALLLVFGGPVGALIESLIGGGRYVQDFYSTTKARERSAASVHAWLDEHIVVDPRFAQGATSAEREADAHKNEERQKKIAFMLFLWLSGTDISDAFGVPLDAWQTPFADWLGLWRWGDAGMMTAPVPNFNVVAAGGPAFAGREPERFTVEPPEPVPLFPEEAPTTFRPSLWLVAAGLVGVAFVAGRS